ncbi:hypothetical protein GCM10023063_39350 [Arthrobacter methylotrophus]
MFSGALAAYVDCSPTPAVASAAMLPLVEAVTAAQPAGTIRNVDAGTVAMAIWGQVHGLVGLELTNMDAPGTEWEGIYAAGLDAVTRGWAS